MTSSDAIILDPNFLLIKNEVNKNFDVDFSLIENLSYQLLIEQQDLRVLSYLLYSLMHYNEIEKFITYLQNFADCLFNNDIIPQKVAARFKIIEWLFSKRVLAFAKFTQFTQEQHAAYMLAINKIHAWALEHNFDTSILSNLDAIIHVKSDEACCHTIPENKSNELTQDLNILASNKDALTSIRAICKYYRDKQNYFTAVALARSIRWTTLNLHFDDFQVTEFSPIDPVKKKHLIALIDSSANLEFINLCEELFLCDSWHLYLEMQWQVIQVLLQMQMMTIVNYLRIALNELYVRLPQIFDLKFNNHEPFITNESKSALLEFITTENACNLSKNQVNNSYKEILDVINKNYNGFDLMITLKAIQEYKQDNNCNINYHMVHKKLAMLLTCVRFGNKVLALNLARDLFGLFSTITLFMWDKSLAVEFLNIYRKLLVSCSDKDKDKKAELLKIEDVLYTVDFLSLAEYSR